MKFRWYQRSLSLLVALVMLVQLVPGQCFAVGTDVFVDSTDIGDIIEESTNDMTAPPEQAEPAKVVGEDPSKRGESYKEFILDNGLRLAAVYPAPVHYQVAEGVWEEIDNTLVAAVSDGVSGYRNAAGDWSVHFPGQLSGSNAITITKAGYEVSFGMAGELRSGGGLAVASIGSEVSTQAQVGTDAAQLTPSVVRGSLAQIQAMDVTAQKAQAQYPETVPDKLHSRVEYPTVYAGTTVRYDLTGQQLKESVILSAYDSSLWGYRYRLDTGTLVPTLNEDKSIDLCDPVTGDTVLYLPAPFLLDDDGAWCGDVDVVLTRSGDGYLLSYYLPRAWLAEEARAWPVVLDPVVQADITRSNIRDATVYQNSRPSNYSNNYWYLGVGRHPTYGIMRSFLKYRDLPALSSADMIIDAQLALGLPDAFSDEIAVEVRRAKAYADGSVWESETVTWANQPGWEKVADVAIVKKAGAYIWNITDIAREWYTEGNTGLVLKAIDRMEYNNSGLQFLSSDNTETARPILMITFRNNNGLESYWDYTTTSAGRAGTGYVNDYTGNLVWIREDMGFGGSRMPVSISHVYNSNDHAINRFGMGYGWRTNYNQRLLEYENANAVTEYYIWEDGDGTSHYFYEDEDTGKYKDEDGLELTLKMGSEINVQNAKYGIFDKDGNASYFDANGRLIRLENTQKVKSYISITYLSDASLKISTITDGAGRKYTFTYSSGLLSTLRYYGTGSTVLRTICYYYDNSQLTSVRDPDLEYSCFTYDTNNLLLSARDIDGYLLTYTYHPVEDASYQPHRVASVTENDGADGSSLSLSYGRNCTTFTDQSGHKQVKQFNNWGNTMSIQDDQGRAQYVKYANNDPQTETGKGNQLKLSSKLQNTVSNLLQNTSFEGTMNWSSTGSGAMVYASTGGAYLGSKSLRLSHSSAVEGAAYQTVTLWSNTDYIFTFSAYVKTVGTSAYLSASRDGITYTSEVLAADSGWTRLQVSIPSSSSSDITLRVVATDVGDVYMDCVQLEKAPTASRYNLVENGDFRYANTAWGTYDYTFENPVAPELEATIFETYCDPTLQSRTSQTIPVSGSADDTFVVAGWAKAYALPIPVKETNSENTATEQPDRKFGIMVEFLNGSTVKSTKMVQFNTCVSGWQYVAQPVVADEAYTSIKLYLVFDYNYGTALFDGIQMFKEEYGQTYDYDDDGNLKSVTDLKKQETTYKYESNKLTEMTLPTGAKLSYEYDTFGNVTRATTDTGVVYEFVYDDWGNNTEVAIVSGSTRLKSMAEYSSDHNRLVSTTDAAGNTTTYGYNAQTNVLEWVRAPEDTDATRTEYTYDNMYRMASAVVETDTGLELSARYTYTDDQLTAIETESTTYGFTYGAFGMRTSVKAGNHVLAEYEYTQFSDLVQELTYGNGDHVTYSYDSTDRLVSQTYEDGETVRYQYDNNGGLAKVIDSETGITSTYYYDFIDRLCHYTEEAEGYSLALKYTFGEMDEVTFLQEIIDGSARSMRIAYDDDQRVSWVRKGTVKETYTYDDFSRVVSKATTQSDVPRLNEQIVYRIPEMGQTSGQVSYLTVSSPVAGGYSNTFSYSYDANGNITDVISGGCLTSYTYDTQNQLIRTDDQAAGKSWTWTYDDAGNILSRSEYAYTTGTLGTALDTVSYGYYPGSWGDLLISYDGQNISYDNIGNPLTMGGRTLTWKHGRELASLTEDGTTWTYTYNADGLRIGRTDGTNSYQYVYADGQLVKAVANGRGMRFSYDANGTPMAVYFAGAEYYYVTNIQGDVVAILDANGAAVVTYTYDPWGKLLSTGGAMASTLGRYNPLLYRGYVYDVETGLYYLQSRCYDPEMGRFINADAVDLLGANGDFASLNLFAYCGNNPVIRADSEGTFWHIVGGAVLGAVAGTVTKMITNAISGQKITDGLLTAGISGAVSGGLAASGVGLVGQVVGNALIGAGNNAADQLIGMANGTKTDGFDVGSMLLDGAIGAVAGFAGGAGAGNRGLTKIGLTNVKRTWNALTHKGAKVALEVLGQGLSYFGKNAQHMVEPLVTAVAKSSVSVIINNSAKVMLA